MRAFHTWYNGEVEAMIHYMNQIETHLNDLTRFNVVGGEMKAVASTRKIFKQFRIFESQNSQLPLNPRYIFFKYAYTLLPKVHVQVMYAVFEKMYGPKEAYNLTRVEGEGEWKRMSALREVYR